MTEDTGKDSLVETRWRWWEGGPFLALLLLSLGLRLNGMGRPAWIDEVFTLDWAAKGYGDIFSGYITPFMPSTARTMFVFFRSGAVSDEFLVRLPHLFFGLAGIAVVFALLRRRFGFVAAFASALFLGTLPRHVAFSQEARYYAFAMLDATLLLAAVMACVKSFSPKALVFVFITCFLGMFNHLSFVFPMAALAGVGGLLLLLQRGEDVRVRVRRVIVFGLVSALGACAAFVPSLCLMERGRLQGISEAVHVSGDAAGEADDSSKGTEAGKTAAPAAFGNEAPGESASASRSSYRLTWRIYWSAYLRQYLCAPTGFFLCLSLLLAALGLFFAFQADRGLALMLASLLVIHVPFLFLSTGHTWSPRYFAVQIVALAILSGIGLAGCVRLAQKSLSRLSLQGPLVAAAVIVLYGAFLYAGRNDAYARRHEGNSDQGQQAIARAIAVQALPGDTVAIVGGQWGWQPTRVLKYYLERKLADNPSLWYGLNWKYCGTMDRLEPVLAARRGGSLWVVTQNEERSPDGFAAMTRFPADANLAAGESQLWIVGRETVNLLGGGDFEAPLEGVRIPEGGMIVEGIEAFEEGHSLKISVPPDTDVEKRPMPTVSFTPVRDPEGRSTPYITLAGTVYSLSFMLKCADLVPGKFPSRTVRVVVEGKDGSGKPYFADFLHISGTRDWQRYEVSFEPGVDMPGDLREFRLGIGNRGGTGTFWLDAVQLERHARATPFTRDVRATHKAGG